MVGGLSIGLLIAGLISPIVGRAIQDYGGHRILAVSSILLATGLVGIGLSQNIFIYLCAWIVIGLGMSAGLYDAAFATLGRIYQERARSAITTLTLFGGFSSTICWPLSGLFVGFGGWRTACFIYGGLQLVLSLPIYLLLLPRGVGYPESESVVDETATVTVEEPPTRKGFALFVLVAAGITLAAVIQSNMAIHLLTILQSRSVGLAAAVALGTLVGPSQVLARVLEMIIGRRFHPIWTMVASTVLVAAGLMFLLLRVPVIAVGLVLYGAGMGVMSIARGTVPLALFGPSGYAVLMGRLALPSLLAQAIAPLLGAFLLERSGATQTLLVLAAVALLNVVLVGALSQVSTRSRGYQEIYH